MMEKIREISKKIGALEFVQLIYLFGSKVINPTKIKSDIDLCIVIKDNSDKNLIYEQIADYIQTENMLIHPVIFNRSEFENKIKIKVYKESIIDKGKLMYKK